VIAHPIQKMDAGLKHLWPYPPHTILLTC
jgi:hypothetical protein